MLLATILWLLVPSSPARAHVALEDTTPAASSVLAESPPEIRLDFAGPVETRLASIELFDSHASKVTIGSPRHDGDDRSTLVATVPPLADGVFVVAWRVLSVDGYPTDGAFTFQVGEQTGTGQVDVAQLLDRVLAGSHADSTVGWALGAARWIGLLGALVLIGGAAFVAWAGPRGGVSEPVRRLLWSAWSASLAGSIGVLVLQGPHVTRRSLGDALDPELWGEVLGTRSGRAIELRWALLLGAGYLVSVIRRHREGWWRGAGVAVAVGLATTYSLGGHPGSSGARFGPVVGVALDALHLLAAAVWLGGLAVLMAQRPAAAHAVRRFATAANLAIPVVVVTGVLQALRLTADDGGLADRVGSTTWGRVLLVKLVVVALVLVIAAVARWLLAVEGAGSLGRLIGAEVVLGVAVVALSASLVSLPPRGETAARPVVTTLVQGAVLLELTVTPARLGVNEVHLMFLPPGGALQQVSGATAVLEPPDPADPSVPVELVVAGPNHWSGLVRIDVPSEWTLVVQVLDAAGERLEYRAEVPVER